MGFKELVGKYKAYEKKELEARKVRREMRKRKATFEKDISKAKSKNVHKRRFSGARYLAEMPGEYGLQGRKLLKKRKAIVVAKRKKRKAKKKAKRKKTIIIYR